MWWFPHQPSKFWHVHPQSHEEHRPWIWKRNNIHQMRGYSGLANPTLWRDILWIKLRINNYRIKVAGTHIPSRLVAPDDNNLVQTIKITLRVALQKSEVLLNQKIFSKILTWFYTFSLCSDYFSDPLKMFRIMVNNKQLLSAMKS